jgi:hypothetical protein
MSYRMNDISLAPNSREASWEDSMTSPALGLELLKLERGRAE